MFNDCSSLTSLDLSSFNTANVTGMNSMFNSCSNLTTIYASEEWSTASVTYSNYMFSNCTQLIGGKGTAFDAEHIDHTYARIDDPDNGQPGYFTDKTATGVEAINNEQLIMNNARGIYDMQGRRVSEFGTRNSALKPGIYVKNGRKVVVK